MVFAESLSRAGLRLRASKCHIVAQKLVPSNVTPHHDLSRFVRYNSVFRYFYWSDTVEKSCLVVPMPTYIQDMPRNEPRCTIIPF